MADTKISALPAATLPLAGTEVLPIVQGGTTDKVSVANLTAGRTQTSNGIVQGTAGTGYNFTANTPAAGMTSQLLNWYEEGTWTPTDASGAGLTLTVSSGTCFYTRIGRQVTCSFAIAYPSTANTASAVLGGLPFVATGSSAVFGGFVSYTDSSLDISFLQTAGQAYFNLYKNTGVDIKNNEMSAKALRGTIVYFV